MSITEELVDKYQEYLGAPVVEPSFSLIPSNPSVAIVGGGMAGLSAAFYLQQFSPSTSVTVFEANERVGGRIYTHKFSDEPYQYFEAGATCIPKASWQKELFGLIKSLNSKLPAESRLTEIPFYCSFPSGNRVYVNGTKQADGKIMSANYANDHSSELGFPEKAEAMKPAKTLIWEAIKPVWEKLLKDTDAFKKYDPMTLHRYLSEEMKWSEERINYTEVMTSQTNEFQMGLVDHALVNADFMENKVSDWITIEGGMSKIPKALAESIGEEKIILQATVDSIVDTDDGKVEIGYTKGGSRSTETFDAVILALPPCVIRMIPVRPRWSFKVEHYLRSVHYQPLHTMGLRFKSRFWEREDLRPSRGGASITDLPARRISYPSYGLGDKGKGVLVVSSIVTDASHWLSRSKKEKVKLALLNLKELYPEVDIDEEYAGGSPDDASYLDEAFVMEWPLGNAAFHPGQFATFKLNSAFPTDQGNIVFAGEHLQTYHSWIVGAVLSAKAAAKLVVGKVAK